MRLLLIIFFAVSFCGCSHDALESDNPDVIVDPIDLLPEVETVVSVDLNYSQAVDSIITLTGPFIERDPYDSAEMYGRFSLNAIWYHEPGTRGFMAARIDCPDMPTIDLNDLAFYVLPDSVEVGPWMGLRHADFGNWSWDVDPERSEVLSGMVQFVNPRYDLERWGNNIDRYTVLRYSLVFDSLRFSNGIFIPHLKSQDYRCYPDEQYWPGPDV